MADKGEKAEEKEEARETGTAKQVRTKWGMKRNYIQEKGSEGLWKTIVTVSEKKQKVTTIRKSSGQSSMP